MAGGIVALGSFVANGNRYTATIGFLGDWRVRRVDGGGWEIWGADRDRATAIGQACRTLDDAHLTFVFSGLDVGPIEWTRESGRR